MNVLLRCYHRPIAANSLGLPKKRAFIGCIKMLQAEAFSCRFNVIDSLRLEDITIIHATVEKVIGVVFA